MDTITPRDLDIIVDGAYDGIAVFARGELVTVTDEADMVAEDLTARTGLPLTEEEENMDSHDMLDAWAERVGIFLVQQGRISPTGLWKDVPATLAAVRALA